MKSWYSWLLALAWLATGCAATSRSQPDPDEDEWTSKWSSDDASGGRHDAQVRGELAEDPADPPRPAPLAAEKPEPVLPRPDFDRPPVELATDQGAPRLEEVPEPGADQGWQTEPAPVPRPPRPTPAPLAGPPPEPRSVPAPDAPEARPAAAATLPPNFLVEAAGGMVILRGARVQPAVGLGLGWNLGKYLGWPGLYLKGDVDIFVGDSPLGAEYVMLDCGLGLAGRFALGPVYLVVILEFALRDMFITQESSATLSEPQLGFGLVAGAALDVPLTGWLSLQLCGDVRYLQEPLKTRSRLDVSAVVSGGLGFAF